MKRCEIRFVIAMAIVLCAGTAGAAPVYTGSYVDMYLKQNTFPGGLSEENVYLDAASASTTITGHVGSQTNLRLVTFSSTTDTLNASNGFASIQSATDDYINNLTVTAPGYWFEDLIFSVNLSPSNNMDLSVTATDKSGGTNTFASWVAAGLGNGENQILVLSTGGNLMQSVTINSYYGFQSIGGLDDAKHFQFSGVTAVPEADTYAMLLAGLGLVGFAARRKLA
ncbi:MAG: FxDxF family PEP-CTERM protein [Thiobacillus sp.]